MFRRQFRPAAEALDRRCLLSANPALIINNVALAEGNSGQAAMVFTVTLSKPSSKPVSVNFATSSGTATAGLDFVSQSGLLTFAPGETTKTITVLVIGDTDIEAHEQFTVNLSGAKGAKIANAVGQGTILNDDLLPYVPQDPLPDDGGCSPDGPYVCP